MNKITKIAIALLILAVGAFFVYRYVYKDIANVKTEKADFTVSSVDLLKEATTSDTTARKKYIDKVVEVSGPIREIIYNDSASVLNLGDTINPSVIICMVDKRNNDNAKKLKKGDTVRVKGRLTAIQNLDEDPAFEGMGISLGTNIEMKDCNIENKK
jgi:hypothetical protein